MKNRIFTIVLSALFGIVLSSAPKVSEISASTLSVVTGDSCIASFTYVSNGNGTVTFYDSTFINSTEVGRHWSFGDGDTSNLQNPTHTYASGIYNATACLTVYTTTGQCTACKEIIVRPAGSCQADFIYEPLVTSGDTSVFSPTYRFTDVSSVSTDIAWRRWSLPDSSFYTDSTFVHTFDSILSNGTVCLTIQTISGCQSSMCKNITPSACVADFTYSANPNGTVYFYNQSPAASDSATWFWSFGDGTSSTQANPVHTYASNITQANVCLFARTATDSCSACKTVYIKSNIDSCRADFIYSPVYTGDTTAFTNTISFTDVSSGYGGIAWRRWSLPDSSFYTDSTFVHTFDSSLSEANVCLTIGTNSGCQSSICKSIPLKNCIADFNYSANANGMVYFYNQSQVSLNAAIWQWNFGDGTTSTQVNPVHTYASNINQAYVCLTVKTSMDTCTICKMVYIRNSSDTCQANFMYELITNSDTAQQYRFTDVSTTYGGTSWRLWTFPDSTTSSDSTFVHTFAPGTNVANVCLSINTYSGCSSSTCKTIYVNDTVPNNSCKADFSYTVVEDSLSATPIASHRVYFTDLSSSSGIINYRVWDFGDGTYSTDISPSHLYSYPTDTTVYVGLFIGTTTGCADSIIKPVHIPGPTTNLLSMSGIVQGKNELLQQGIIVLYRKTTSGLYSLQDANIVNNGVFAFTGIPQGKYILYCIPHVYLSEKYYPTYYVNKLHWANADIINLNSNIGGLTLKMISARSLNKGSGKISGTVIINTATSESGRATSQSMLSGLSTPVYLYTPSGEVLSMSLTDSNDGFAFNKLPYGTYVLAVESMNAADYQKTIVLSPDVPEVNDVVFDFNNALTIDNAKAGKFTVRKVDAGNVALHVSQSGEYTCTFVSLSGRVVMQGKLTADAGAETIISISSLPDGIYIIKLNNSNTSMVTKFIK